ncbi:MAG TPA: DUF5335 family protein [Gammaproteobacteria bacterium]|nr:DUF5335 family protein [Gammaproteobacteria bacterium]
MPIQHLDKSRCQPYFAQISRELAGRAIEVDVAGLGIHTPYQLDWTPLRDVAYYPDKDAFQIVTDDLDHLIPRPHELNVDIAEDGLHSIEVIDAAGQSRTLRLRAPLPLP